ncbi:hypothetical protein KFE25_011146 [Diacronema lutheri]|uniref:Uncharacterized protein n=2 Tax=Diacronema lutheri TaxID=2081491 RepID=A0A8J6C7X0_DIALT|nr:hypothetical protein KFE25_011146 [Diacronema lutheri]
MLPLEKAPATGGAAGGPPHCKVVALASEARDADHADDADDECARDEELLHPAGSEALDRRTALALGVAAFGFYSSIYFIKVCVFAARWHGATWHGVDLKTALAIGQSTGYLVGKVPAALLTPKLRRSQLLGAVLGVLWCAGSLIFALGALPTPLSVPCLFLASAALASAWSLLMRFIEGRARTDAIVALVSLSWIGVSGVVKSVGAELVLRGLTERAMVCTCASFGVVSGTICAVAMATRPPPSAADEAARGARREMRSIRREGLLLLTRHGLGIALTTAAYSLCGTVRVFRDFFLPELFAEVGVHGHPAAFALSEGAIALLVIATIGSFARIESNWLALNVILATAMMGVLLAFCASILWRARAIGGLPWVTLVGAGIFLMYMPIGCVLYDRLLAAAREQLTTTLLSVLSDAATTACAAALLIYKEFGWAATRGTGATGEGVTGEGATGEGGEVSAFFAAASTAVCAISALLLLGATVAFNRSVSAALGRRLSARVRSSVVGTTDAPSLILSVGGEQCAADGAHAAAPDAERTAAAAPSAEPPGGPWVLHRTAPATPTSKV